jgi:phage shock protein A
MPIDGSKQLATIRQQIAELDALARQTCQDLNTVAGTERVAKWKSRTVALITAAVSDEDGQTFAQIQPGPSFTNDLLEEFTDLIECYRTPLVSLADKLARSSSPGS